MKSDRKNMIAVILIIYIIGMLFVITETSKAPKQITGLSSTGIVRLNILAPCNYNLKSEYNFISLCANVTNTSVRKVLESINGQYSFVLSWDKNAQEFETFSPEAAANDFEKFELNKSYFIFMNSDDTLNINNEALGDMNISLIEQYNAAAYPFAFDVNVVKYIAPIQENVSFVLKWNTTTQQFQTYSPEAATNEFEQIKIGDGQFIYMNRPSILKYNKTGIRP